MPAKLKVHQRHFLKSKDIKQLKIQLKTFFSDDIVSMLLPKKSRTEWIKLDQNQELYAIDGVLTLWLKGDLCIPLLSYLMNHELPMKSVKVDTGAIKFVSNGADTMRPGIIEIDPTIEKDDIIAIKDPQHGRVLAIGKAIYNAAGMESLPKGKAIKSLHSISDQIWAFSREF